ncbi:outer membrane efflux protein [Plesiocystis pacifica SIR-1]|uniref:Outer membrane efflux protein n=2 Tax=Plesiocystis pacifica TaxID=191768 RepID=A6GEX3_9BACT|nr:outer membrane efflux protein [Plesiocystis pacifica SIR-1]
MEPHRMRTRAPLFPLSSVTLTALLVFAASPGVAQAGPLAKVAAAPAPEDPPAPKVQDPPSQGQGQAAADGGIEGVEGPVEVPEFENPIVAALQPVPGGLTSEEVARRAVEGSPMVAAKQAELAAAEAQLDQTIIQFLPRLEGKFTYTRLSQATLDFGFDSGDDGGFIVGALNEGPLTFGPCEPGSIFQCVLDSQGVPVGAVPLEFDLPEVPQPPLNSYSLQAILGVPISDYIARLPTAKKAGEAQIRAAELARQGEQLNAERDARIAYYDWVRATANKVALQESLTRTEARLEDAKSAFDAGIVSNADVMRLDAAVATLTAASIRAESFETLAAEYLATLMAEEGFPSYQIGEDLFAPQADLPEASELETMVAEAERERVEMKAFDTSTEALELGIKTTRAGYYPRVDGFAEATYANPNQRFFPADQVWNGSWSVGVTLSWVLTDALMTKAKVREYDANLRSLEAQREALRRGLVLEVASIHADRQSTLAELEYIQRAEQSAEEGYRVAVDLYQVGDATTTDILDAEYGRVEASLRSINAQIDLRIANVKLEYALGRVKPVSAAE